jgi:hypothetical protein
MSRFPPSLSSVPGWTDAEIEDRVVLDRLAQIMRRLPLRRGVNDAMIEAMAGEVYYHWYVGRRHLERQRKKASPGRGRGRPPKGVADDTALGAALAYQRLTGKWAKRGYNAPQHKPKGEFLEFLTEVFKVLGIDASPDAANQGLQNELAGRPRRRPNKNHKPENKHHMT